MRAVGGPRSLLFLVELCKSFPKWVDEDCGICSSKDIVQPHFHEESLNVK